MADDLTLILGPQSTGALHLNTFVRQAGGVLSKQGVRALPTRVSAPLLRRCIDTERPYRERKADFDREVSPRPAVLSALNLFGPPEAALARGAFFPNAEPVLGPVGKIIGHAQVVLVVDTLPRLFLAPGSERLEARVRGTGWETLYELGWTDLARVITDKMKAASLLVLTPRGMALRSGEVLERLFCPGITSVCDPHWLFRQAISETGHAVLDRLLEQGTPDEATLKEVYASFAIQPSLAEIEERLGIEKITATLLEQRFQEDLNAIAALPRTEVI